MKQQQQLLLLSSRTRRRKKHQTWPWRTCCESVLCRRGGTRGFRRTDGREQQSGKNSPLSGNRTGFEQGCPNSINSRVPTNQFSRPTPHPQASLPIDVPLSPRFALASGCGPPAPLGSPWRCASFLARFLRGWVGFLFGVLVRGWVGFLFGVLVRGWDSSVPFHLPVPRAHI